MYKVSGGVSWALLASLASAVVFFIGAFTGYTNPTKCNNQKRKEKNGIKNRRNA